MGGRSGGAAGPSCGRSSWPPARRTGTGETAEVVGGLNPTDKLIATGRERLKPGSAGQGRRGGPLMGAMPLVEIENLSKVYRKGAQEVPVLRDLNLAVEAGEFLALMGPSGSRQDDAAQPDRRDRPADVRRRSASAGRTCRKLSRNRLAAWRAAPRRLHLPALQPDPGADRVRERRTAAAAAAAVAGRAAEAGGGRARRGRPARPATTTTRGSSPAGRSSASPSPGRSSPTRPSSSPTSRPATSTPRPPTRR